MEKQLGIDGYIARAKTKRNKIVIEIGFLTSADAKSALDMLPSDLCGVPVEEDEGRKEKGIKIGRLLGAGAVEKAADGYDIVIRLPFFQEEFAQDGLHELGYEYREVIEQ